MSKATVFYCDACKCACGPDDLTGFRFEEDRDGAKVPMLTPAVECHLHFCADCLDHIGQAWFDYRGGREKVARGAPA